MSGPALSLHLGRKPVFCCLYLRAALVGHMPPPPPPHLARRLCTCACIAIGQACEARLQLSYSCTLTKSKVRTVDVHLLPPSAPHAWSTLPYLVDSHAM